MLDICDAGRLAVAGRVAGSRWESRIGWYHAAAGTLREHPDTLAAVMAMDGLCAANPADGEDYLNAAAARVVTVAGPAAAADFADRLYNRVAAPLAQVVQAVGGAPGFALRGRWYPLW